VKNESIFFIIVAWIPLCGLGCAAVPTPFEEDMTMDGGNEPQCRAAGGTCTTSLNELCEADAEPLTSNDQENTECDGHCCVLAAPNMCNDKSEWACIPEECTGNWATVEGDVPCGNGRVCCYWAS
jgi:hypothetical protein